MLQIFESSEQVPEILHNNNFIILDHIVENCYRFFHSRFRIWICDSRHSVILTGILEVRLADIMPSALLHKVYVNMDLPPISLKLFSHLLHVRLLMILQFEIMLCEPSAHVSGEYDLDTDTF